MGLGSAWLETKLGYASFEISLVSGRPVWGQTRQDHGDLRSGPLGCGHTVERSQDVIEV